MPPSSNRLSGQWARNWWDEFGPNAFTEKFVGVVEEILSDSDVDYAEIVEKIDKVEAPGGKDETTR